MPLLIARYNQHCPFTPSLSLALVKKKEISGRLHSIELNVIAQDYQVIMQILEKNMKEGQNEFKKPKRSRSASQQATQQGDSKGEKFSYKIYSNNNFP